MFNLDDAYPQFSRLPSDPNPLPLPDLSGTSIVHGYYPADSELAERLLVALHEQAALITRNPDPIRPLVGA
jgi:hypothetical protein